MVRRSASNAVAYREDDDDDDRDDVESGVSDESEDSNSQSRSKKTPKKKKGTTPRKKISPFKTPASRRSHSQAASSDDENDEDEEDDYPPPSAKKRKSAGSAKKAQNGSAKRRSGGSKGELVHDDSDDEDYGVKKKKKKGKSSPKKTPAKKSKAKSIPLTKRNPKKRYYSDDDDDDAEEEEEEEEESEEEEEAPRSSKKSNGTKRNSVSTEKMPPIPEMVIESIKALKDNPKKGSTFSSIKDTIALNWDVNMPKLGPKIKKYIIKAVTDGDLIRTRGTGVRGRFTVPGMKIKRKKKSKSSLSKKFDEDELEYVPAKTARDEERLRDKEELERRREDRAIWKEKIAAEKAAKPKAPPKPKKEHWEVKGIQGVKHKGEDIFYLVKYEGSYKPQWEPEENLEGCRDLVEMYLKEEELKKAAKERIRREAEEKGVYEVNRILEVKYKKDKTREFLIRWKGWGQEGDSWEEEANLDCENIIQEFMRKVDAAHNVSQKQLREAPKKVERLAFAQSKRLNKKRGGFRVTYEDME